ncbi:hypothetical protein NDU88_003443 [Pleurodeles waltl]|uniref:Uncharacterized protein n=1 Tax=Pleurodeles waltl TaxID=8319 RepID=A0AAV7VDE0_PLEWA|nr:hypothetical protein NDU88_003443 [Pleurodeles waltl]
MDCTPFNGGGGSVGENQRPQVYERGPPSGDALHQLLILSQGRQGPICSVPPRTGRQGDMGASDLRCPSASPHRTGRDRFSTAPGASILPASGTSGTLQAPLHMAERSDCLPVIERITESRPHHGAP